MQTLEKNVTNTWGKKGKEWLKNQPKIIDELSKHWQLSDIKPVQNMSWNYVGLAIQNRDVPVALKFSCDKQLMQDEYTALKHFYGHGSIKVFDFNLEKNALLLERAIPGDLLKDDHSTKTANTIAIYAEVVNQLSSRPLPKEHGYKHASDWLKAIDKISDKRVEKRYMEKAQKLRSFLLNSKDREYLCHGDLHLENIIKHEDIWFAIDPKGIIGEMAFEASAFDLISKEEMKDTETFREKITEKVALLSNALNLDYDRLLYWIFLRVIISVQWFIEVNGDPSFMIYLADGLYPLLMQPKSSLS